MMLFPCSRPHHCRRLLVAALGLFVLLGSSGRIQAQPPPGSGLPTPRLFTVYPCGAKAGSSVEITLSGQDLEDPEELLFSQPGIKATYILPPEPADPKKPPAKAEPKRPAGRRRAAAPTVAVKFKVMIPGDTPPGIHDVRVVNHWGVSNPRAFVVGDLSEVQEIEPNNDVPQSQRIELNSTVNGVISAPTDVDYYVFKGKRGQRVLASCLASSIDSRLMAAVEMYDSSGNQVAFNRHYHANDALVDYTLPADGDYTLRVFEFTHTQGSPEHYYRLTVSTAPWIDAIQPLAIQPGKAVQLTVYGRNLPGGQPDPSAVEDGVVLEKLNVQVTVPAQSTTMDRLSYQGHVPPSASMLDGFEYRVRNSSGISNPFLLSVARAPVVVDNGANDTPATAQPIKLPCEISGQVEKRHDRDWYSFSAKAGDVHVIEVLSDRLGAPTDMHLVVRKADTKQELADVDDDPDVMSQVQFYARSEDPAAYRFAVPADGTYQLLIASRDADNRMGPRRYYHVRIEPERPDFRLVVLPSDEHRPEGCCLRQGGHENLNVLVWRKDGFRGPITLTAEGLPKGVTCAPQTIGPSLRHAALVVSAAADAPVWTGSIRVKASAVINGETVLHEARAASVTWPVQQQQGIPAVSRLDRGLVMAVRDKAPFGLTATPEKTAVLQGSKVNVSLKVARTWPELKGAIQVAAIDPPTHLPANLTFNNNQPFTVAAGKNDGTAVLNVNANVQPGTYNVVLRGTVQVPYNKDPMASQKPNINVIQASAPFAITILPKQVANLSVANPNVSLKAGSPGEFLVRVARLNDFAGPFRVQLVLPPGMTGIVAPEIVIPPGKNEARLLLNVASGAPAGSRSNLIVRATATLAENTTLVHESKVNINVIR